MSSIFGGSQQQSTNQSTSQNQAYPQLSAALGGQVTNGTTASNGLAGLLGGNGQAAQDQAFNNFRNSTGYQFGLDQGSQAVTQNAAAKGLLNSGSTAKALDTYGQNYANSQYQNYTNLLQNQVNSGNQAAGVIGATGQKTVSNGTSSGQTNPNVGGFLGALL